MCWLLNSPPNRSVWLPKTLETFALYWWTFVSFGLSDWLFCRNIAVPCPPDLWHTRISADEVAREVRIVAEICSGVGRRVLQYVETVRLLMRAAILRLENETRAKSMHPARSVILAGVIGDALTPGQYRRNRKCRNKIAL